MTPVSRPSPTRRFSTPEVTVGKAAWDVRKRVIDMFAKANERVRCVRSEGPHLAGDRGFAVRDDRP